MSPLVPRYFVALVFAGLAFLFLKLGRGFYTSHAALVSIAIGALVFTTWRTLDRWRGQ